jgi:hypothetical protein
MITSVLVGMAKELTFVGKFSRRVADSNRAGLYHLGIDAA